MWPDGIQHFSIIDYRFNFYFPNKKKGIIHLSYNMAFFVFTYVLPGLIMIFCYSKMSISLWRKTDLGNCSESLGRFQLNIRKSSHFYLCFPLARAHEDKKNVVKMFITVVSLFLICWLPYNLYFLYIYHRPEAASWASIQDIYLLTYWLAMANSSFNPIIYYTMNKR